jgi:hypothetical protein
VPSSPSPLADLLGDLQRALGALGVRSKDLEDVIAILRARGNDLDVEQIRETLRRIAAALSRADLVPELDRALALVTRGERA